MPNMRKMPKISLTHSQNLFFPVALSLELEFRYFNHSLNKLGVTRIMIFSFAILRFQFFI